MHDLAILAIGIVVFFIAVVATFFAARSVVLEQRQ